MTVHRSDIALICKADFGPSDRNGPKVKSAAHQERKMRDKVRALVIPRW
jgi:hypothetical protein